MKGRKFVKKIFDWRIFIRFLNQFIQDNAQQAKTCKFYKKETKF